MIFDLYFKSRIDLPSNLTSYDLLKSFALLTMIIDHLGYYFFPDEMTWRLIGRMSLPVWMFLVGYAKSRDLGHPIIIGALACALAEYFIKGDILAINILFSIILVRFSLDYTMKQMFDNKATLFIIPAILIVMILPSWFIFEYGTAGLMIAMIGWLLRNKEQNPIYEKTLMPFSIVTFIAFLSMTSLSFGFNNVQIQILIVLLSVVFLIIYNFKPHKFQHNKESFIGKLTPIIQFMGRYSLEFYIIHVIFFVILSSFLGIKT